MNKNEIGCFYLESIRDFYSRISKFLTEITEEQKRNIIGEIEEDKIARIKEEKIRFDAEKQKLVFKALVAQSYNYSIIEGEYYSNSAQNLLKEIEKLHEDVQKQIENQPIPEIKEQPQVSSPTAALQSETLLQQLTAERTAFFQEVVELTEDYPEFNRHYRYFVEKIEHRLDQTDDEDILDHDFDQELSELKNIPSLAPSPGKMFYHIFLLNIKIAEFDEGYEGYICDQTATKSLIYIILLIQNRLASGSFLRNLVSDCLSEKCTFLLLKIYRRYKKDAIDYVITTQKREQRFNPESLEARIRLFKSFNEKSKRHYNDLVGYFGNRSLTIAEKFRSTLELSKESDLNIERIHFICKFIRSNAEDISKERKVGWSYFDTLKFLENLLEKVIRAKKAKNLLGNRTDLYAFESVKHLIKNVIFKLKIENVFCCDRTINEYLALVEPLTTYYNANKQKPKDFHINTANKQDLPDPYLSKIYCTLLYRLYGKIRDILVRKNERINEHQSDKIAELSGEYFNADTDHSQFLTLVNKQALMPIYLSISECIRPQKISPEDYSEWFDFHYALKEIKENAPPLKNQPVNIHAENILNNKQTGRKLNLFLDSGYISPINYQKLIDEHKAEKNEVVNLIALISTLVTLAPLQTYKGEIDKKFDEKVGSIDKKFDEKVKESQYTAIQLVGFFIGVITFILSTVSVVPKFNKGNSFEVVFTFMLVFAGSLVLFTLVIAYLTRFKLKTAESKWYDDLKDPKMWLIIIISLSIITIGFVSIYKFSEKDILAEDLPTKVEIIPSNLPAGPNGGFSGVTGYVPNQSGATSSTKPVGVTSSSGPSVVTN